MVRQSFPTGTERLVNGYVSVKQHDGTWKYKHHIIAEEKLGRPLGDNELVKFVDGDRTNFNLNNIDIRWKAPTKQYRRRAHLRRQIIKVRGTLDDLERQLELLGGDSDGGHVAEEQEGRGGRPYQ